MLSINERIYNKFGDEGIVESKTEDSYIAMVLRTYYHNIDGEIVRSAPVAEKKKLKDSDMGVTYFYELEDIGNMEKLTDSNGRYVDNIVAIRNQYERDMKANKNEIPIGEVMDARAKQEIIDAYYSPEQIEEERVFYEAHHGKGFARIDFETEYSVGHDVKYFRTKHHDICYLTKGPYHRFGNIQMINWRSEMAGVYYDKKIQRVRKGHYLDIISSDRATDVAGIEYQYELMLKRKFTANPFEYQNEYIGGIPSKPVPVDTVLYNDGGIDPFLLKIIEQKRLEHKLTDIILSIQENQNKIIRYPKTKNMLIQGCAGSGKTMILLHRISYLLYNKLMRDLEKTIIIVPNKRFSMFIDDLADYLEFDRIPRVTMRQYYLKLVRKYQKVVDEDFGEPSQKIEEWFCSLEQKSFMTANTTCPDEQFNEEFEYALCEYYDKALEQHLEGIHLNDILQIAHRLGIKVEIPDMGYEKLNYINELVTNRIIAKAKRMEDEQKEKIDDAERNLKKYKEFASKLERYTKIVEMIIELNRNNEGLTYSDLLEDRNKLVEFKDRIEMKRKMVDEKRGQINQKPRGFMRLISNNKAIAQAELEKNEAELNDLEAEYIKMQGEIVDSASFEMILELQKCAEEIQDIAAERRKITSLGPFSQFLEQTSFVLKVIFDGEVSLIEAQKELNKLCERFDALDTFVEAKERYARTSKKMDEIQKKKPSEEESALLKKAEKVLKNRRFFVLNLLEGFCRVPYEKVSKGQEIFVLLALYCMHIGHVELEVEYLFIDEGQDYSESEYRILRAIHGDNTHFEIYGDILQCITPNRGLSSWESVKFLFEADCFELKENYRNTVEIADYINENIFDVFNPFGIRGPEVHPAFSWLDVKKAMRKDSEERVAIICHDKEQLARSKPSFTSLAETNEILYNVLDAKGLEFDTVFVIEDDMSENEKYVAFSRALNQLRLLRI